MFKETVNTEELSKVAEEFEQLLIYYSANYPEAKNVLERSSTLLKSAINHEIVSPYQKGFLPEEFWEDGRLFELNDLSEKCAQFSLLLRGVASIEAVIKEVHAIEKQAALDEKEFRDKNA